MSSYMRGWSKRKPFNADPIQWNMRGFFSSPVRHLLEGLERESALEKPYLDYGPPSRKHQLPNQGQVSRIWRDTSSYTLNDSWRVLYNAPECSLFMFSLDCDEQPLASITIDYRAGWQTGTDIYFGVGCDKPNLISFGETHYDINFQQEVVATQTSGVSFNTPWSSATIQGKWETQLTTPIKMMCTGYVAYNGGWAKEEIKYGSTVVTQSVLVESNSLTPGAISVSGTNPITGARGTSVQTLSELGLDPKLVSLAGHNAVTVAAQLYSRNAVTQALSFNNVVSGRPIQELTRTQVIERLDWINTPGKIISWYGGFIRCPSIEVDVACNGEMCENATRFRWGVSSSAEEVSAGGSCTVAVNGGTPPYLWSVSPADIFSLSARTTLGVTNTLNAAANSCGVAFIKVIDACNNSVTGAVRETGGVNTNWTLESDCGPFNDDAYYAYGITPEGYLAADDWCADICADNCQDTCDQLVPNSIYAVMEGHTPCWVESNRIWSWTCN